MMKSWEIKRLNEICEIAPAKRESRHLLNDEDLVSFVPMSELNEFSQQITLSSEKKLSDVYKGYTYFADGDVLFAKITPCFENGKMGIARGLKNKIGFGSSEFVVLRPKEFIDSGYLFYYLSSDLFREPAKIVMRGASGHKRVPNNYIENSEILVPSLQEQKRIVSVLDEKFAAIDELIKITEQQIVDAKELFKSKLSIFFETEDQWTESTMDEYINFIDYRGRTPKKTSSGTRLITAKNIKKGYLTEDPKEFIDSKDYESWMTRGIPIVGDILFTTEAPLGNVAMLDLEDKVAFAQRTIILQMDRDIFVPKFLFYLILSNKFQRKIQELATGTTVLGIKSSLLKKVKVKYPDIKEQKNIAKELDRLSEHTGQLESIYQQKISNLQELKKSYLAEAFAGKL
jgi:type I restriction enzyme S subunit